MSQIPKDDAVDTDPEIVEVDAATAESAGSSDDEAGSSEVETPEPEIVAPDPRDLRIGLLQRQLDASEERLREYIRAHKKAQAEFEESRRRMKRQQGDEIEVAKGKVVERFLDVADNLDRSLEAVRAGGSLDALLEGVGQVHKMFHQALEELGLERFDPSGTAFDPASMEAYGMIPVSDASQSNTVVNTLRSGYRLRGRELRPALVQVGHFSG